MGDMFSTLRYYLYFSSAIQNRACLAAERADNWFSVCTFPRRQFTFLKGGDGEGWQLIVKVFPKATSRGNPQDLRKKLWNEFMKCRLNGEPTLRLHLLFNNCSFSDISTFFYYRVDLRSRSVEQASWLSCNITKVSNILLVVLFMVYS